MWLFKKTRSESGKKTTLQREENINRKYNVGPYIKAANTSYKMSHGVPPTKILLSDDFI